MQLVPLKQQPSPCPAFKINMLGNRPLRRHCAMFCKGREGLRDKTKHSPGKDPLERNQGHPDMHRGKQPKFCPSICSTSPCNSPFPMQKRMWLRWGSRQEARGSAHSAASQMEEKTGQEAFFSFFPHERTLPLPTPSSSHAVPRSKAHRSRSTWL